MKQAAVELQNPLRAYTNTYGCSTWNIFKIVKPNPNTGIRH